MRPSPPDVPGAQRELVHDPVRDALPARLPLAPRPRRRGRRAWGLAAAAVALSVAAWRAMPASAPDVPDAAGAGPAGAPRWNLQLASGGGSPPWVLVFGRQAGFHLMRVPVGGPRAMLPADVVDRKVWMVSLGRAPLDVRGDAGGAGGLRSFGARARVVTVFQDGSGTGVRTGLRGAMR